MFGHKVINPFTGNEQPVEVNIQEQIEKAEFEAFKDFIKNHLRCALDNEELKANAFKFQRLEWLIVQLYEPTTHITLVSKLLKFQEILFGVKEYNDVLKELKCMPENDLTVGDVKTN